MKRVLGYLRNFKKEMIIGPSFKIIETFFELLTPLIMAKLIDEGIPASGPALIYRYGGMLFLFSVLGYTFTMICQYLAAKAQEGFGTMLRKDLFEHIQGLSLAGQQKLGANSLLTRMTSDIYQLQLALAMFIRIAPRAPFILIGSTVMAFIISPKLSLVFLLIIPCIIFVLFFVMRKTVPLYQSVQKKVDHIGMLTSENLTGARVIRAFTKQEMQFEQFSEKTTDLKETQTTVGKYEALLNPATFFIINIATFIILYIGQFDINVGNLTQGELIALVNYAAQLSIALVVLVNLSVTFSRGYASLVRVGEVFDEPLPIKTEVLIEPFDVKAPALEFIGATFHYPYAKHPVLEGINLAVGKGETLGIIGGTGSGKTSLIRLIGKLYHVTGGELLIDGVDIRDIPDAILHQKVQIVFQKATLFRGTIADNLRMAKPDATVDEMWEALSIAQATEFVESKTLGLEEMIEEGGKNLSGGQRQRLTIARGVIAKPEIIIFDDTSSALDYVTDSKLRKAISNLGITTIIVSQRVHAIESAEQILVLEQGKAVGIGTHQHLLKSCDTYFEIVYSQQSKGGDSYE